MEEFTEVLVIELIKRLVPTVIVATLLCVIFFGAHKVLKNLDAIKYKWVVYCVVIIFFIFNILWAYKDTRSFIADICNEVYVSYDGEIEYLEKQSSEYTDVYRLCEKSDVNVYTEIGTVDANIQRCTAHIIYAENSCYILEIEVEDVIETRSPVSVK